MSSKTSSTAGTGDILCPFFVSHSSIIIVCEGDLPESRNSFHFKSKEEKAIQLHCFCEGFYKKCPHYINIMRWGWDHE